MGDKKIDTSFVSLGVKFFQVQILATNFSGFFVGGLLFGHFYIIFYKQNKILGCVCLLEHGRERNNTVVAQLKNFSIIPNCIVLLQNFTACLILLPGSIQIIDSMVISFLRIVCFSILSFLEGGWPDT